MNDVILPGQSPDRSQMDPTWNLMSQAGREFPVVTGRIEDREAIADALRSGH